MPGLSDIKWERFNPSKRCRPWAGFVVKFVMMMMMLKLWRHVLRENDNVKTGQNCMRLVSHGALFHWWCMIYKSINSSDISISCTESRGTEKAIESRCLHVQIYQRFSDTKSYHCTQCDYFYAICYFIWVVERDLTYHANRPWTLYRNLRYTELILEYRVEWGKSVISINTARIVTLYALFISYTHWPWCWYIANMNLLWQSQPHYR
jgi:hypothetical protein